MTKLIATICAGMSLMLASASLLAEPEMALKSTVSPLCTTIVGPAFLIPDESRETIALHAGQFAGVSLLSLTTGRTEGRIPVTQPFLAASMPPSTGILTLAVADRSAVKISSFGVADSKVTSTDVFSDLDAQLAVFAPNGKYLLGVTNTGTVFKVDLAAKKVKVIEGVAPHAASVAVSPTGKRLYVAGDGLIVIDIDNMRVSSTLTTEKNLLEVAANPDDHNLLLRNWHSIELFDLVSSKKDALASVVVDPTPNGVSIDSTRRLAFGPDGSSLFYIRASPTESELVTLSINPLRIETRSPVGPYPKSIAVVPDRKWILLATGFSGQEQLEAIDIRTHALIYKVALPVSSSTTAVVSNGCTSTFNAP